jgi:hypothetical protein
MNTDELRAIIWDDLFRARSSKSMQELAALTQQDVFQVRTAVNHEWFNVMDERVAIAMAVPGSENRST